MHKLEIGGLDRKRPEQARTFLFPASFQECTPHQLGLVVAIVNTPDPAEADEETREALQHAKRLRLLVSLSGVPERLLHHVKSVSAFVFEGGVLPQLDWCFASPLWAQSVVPRFDHAGVSWTGPENGLVNFTVKRWGYADACLGKVGSGEGEAAVNNLLGALYVPAGTTWTNDDIEARGKQLSALPSTIKLAALVNYRALRSWLPKRYPRVFEGGQEDPHGVHGLIVAIAGPKFGDTRTAESAPLHDVLIHCEQTKLEAIEREQKIIVPEGFEETYQRPPNA